MSHRLAPAVFEPRTDNPDSLTYRELLVAVYLALEALPGEDRRRSA